MESRQAFDLVHPRALNLSGEIWRIAHLRVAPESWDAHLWTSAISAVVALAIALIVPAVSDLAVFFIVMLVASGPLSSFLPAASEPVLLAYGQLYHPLPIALIGIGAIVLVEFLNYRVFDSLLNWKRLAKVREARVTRLVVGWFALQPFITVFVAAFSPIPFWIARSCAVLSRYSMPRYICATAAGRFLRLYVIVAIGSALPFSPGQILVAGSGVLALVGGWALVRRTRRHRAPVHLGAAGVAGGSGRDGGDRHVRLLARRATAPAV